MTMDPAVRAAIDAANKNDIAAFLACFTEDGVVDDWGAGVPRRQADH
ncbi:hypothetical protein [Kibdelosporangium aridum]